MTQKPPSPPSDDPDVPVFINDPSFRISRAEWKAGAVPAGMLADLDSLAASVLQYAKPRTDAGESSKSEPDPGTPGAESASTPSEASQETLAEALPSEKPSPAQTSENQVPKAPVVFPEGVRVTFAASSEDFANDLEELLFYPSEILQSIKAERAAKESEESDDEESS